MDHTQKKYKHTPLFGILISDTSQGQAAEGKKIIKASKQGLYILSGELLAPLKTIFKR